MHPGRLSLLHGLIAAAIAFPAASSFAAVLRIDAGHPGVKVSPTFYGLMTEEINHSYDGGLYAELIRNRGLGEDAPKATTPSHWAAVQSGGAEVKVSIDDAQPFNAAFSRSLRVEIVSVTNGQRAGVANDGFWGMAARAGQTYHVSLYAKGAEGFNGPLNLSLESADGGRQFGSARIEHVDGKWQKYDVDLKLESGSDSADNRFVIAAAQPGTVWLQQVSLFPPTWHGRANGNRQDLMARLDALHPTFLRFPGGNYLEGDYFKDRFDWKKTIGDPALRPGHASPWKYWSTDGMGLLEFLEWCENLKMQPVLAVFAGYALRHDYVPAGEKLTPYVQDALDEIEYVSGAPDTRWGGERVRDGHPAPFKLTYVEIGNEDWFDKSQSYDGRFAQFYDAIKAKFPKLQLIATTKVTSRPMDVIDEHFYKRHAKDFYAMVKRYDAYDRNGPKVFVGEWATREGAPTPNLNDALGDFTWMTGMERNSDLVIMNSYAPLLVNVSPGAMQWKTDLIGFDAQTTYGSPSFYAQAMFNRHQGEQVLSAGWDQEPAGLYCSVTGTGGLFGKIYLKVANTTAQAVTAQVAIDGRRVRAKGRETVLAGASPEDTNSITEPEKIIPHDRPLDGVGPTFNHTFPAYSDTVLEIGTY